MLRTVGTEKLVYMYTMHRLTEMAILNFVDYVSLLQYIVLVSVLSFDRLLLVIQCQSFYVLHLV